MRRLHAQPGIEHECRKQQQQKRHLGVGLEDREIAERHLPDPQAGGWKRRGYRVSADQKPEQMMVNELRQGRKRRCAFLHWSFQDSERLTPLLYPKRWFGWYGEPVLQ